MNHVRQLTIALGLAAGILGLLGIVWLCFGPVYPAGLVSCTGDSSGKMGCLPTTFWYGLIKWEGGSLTPSTLLYLSLLALAWIGVVAVSVLLSRFGTWRYEGTARRSQNLSSASLYRKEEVFLCQCYWV